MDAKDSFFVFALLLLSLGLFGSLSLTYCVWNKQTEVASELQNELHSKLRSELQNEMKSELADVRNELHKLQNEMNSRMHLGASGLSRDKGQLKRNVRQADKDTNTVSTTDILTILMAYVNCSRNEFNQTTAHSSLDSRENQVTLDHLGYQDFQDYRGRLDRQENEETKGQREILATQANQATQASRVKEAEGVQLVLQVHLAHRVFLD